MPIPAVSMEKRAAWINFSASASDSVPEGEVKYHQKMQAKIPHFGAEFLRQIRDIPNIVNRSV